MTFYCVLFTGGLCGQIQVPCGTGEKKERTDHQKGLTTSINIEILLILKIKYYKQNVTDSKKKFTPFLKTIIIFLKNKLNN